MFNKRVRRCAAVKLMLSTDPSYDNRTIASKPQNANPDGSTCPGWWKQSFHRGLWSLVWFQVRATSCRLTSSNWGCRIHRQLLCRGVRLPPPNECPGYDAKQSDGKVPVMLELWGIRSTPLLPSLPGPLWPGVVAPDKGPIYGLNRNIPCFFHFTDFCI